MSPKKIPDTFPVVAGSPKNRIPLAATGNLFKAPTIEYVVEDVQRTHHALPYEIKKDEIPERTIATIKDERTSGALYTDALK